jgi:DNA-binding protein HU-beta
MAEKIWLRVPSDEILKDPTGWHRIENSTYLAIRSHVVVVKERDKAILKGPPKQVIQYPAGTKYALEHKRVRVEKHTEFIQSSIQRILKLKLTDEVVAKIGSQIGAKGVIASSVLSSEVQQKCGTELTEAIQRSLAGAKSYEVQYTEEETRSVRYDHKAVHGGSRPPLVLHFYLGLWRWKWTVYLIKVDFLRLQYKRRWLWRDVRKSIVQEEVRLELPLFQVSFYEPQSEWSISEGPYQPDVADEDDIRIVPVACSCPDVRLPSAPALEDLARLAFPVTKEERKRKATKKAELVRIVAESTGSNNKKVEAILDLLAETAVKEVKRSGQFVLPGLGKLLKSHQKARMGRNPQTGKAIKIPAKTMVKFRVAKACKDAIVLGSAPRKSKTMDRTLSPAGDRGRHSETQAKGKNILGVKRYGGMP